MPDLDRIRRDLQSTDMLVVGSAIGNLAKLAGRDPDVHAEALTVFRKWAAAAPDQYVAIQAAKGLRIVAGEEAFREIWLKLLNDPRESFVLNTLHLTTEPVWVPVVLEMLERRTEFSIRQSILCCLGQMQDRSVLPVLLKYLPDKDLKGYAVIGLTRLGDPRAIPHLEACLADKTPLWPVDNHGPMETMGDAAANAIRALRGNDPRGAAPAAASIAGAVAPLRPPAVPSPPTAARVPPPAGPPAQGGYLLAYAPLGAALLTAAIFMVVVIVVLEKRGQSGASGQTQRIVDLVITFPGLAGLLLGIVALSRFATLRLIERVACIAGTILCALIAKSFVLTLLR